jgi:SET domain-containing protein
VCVAFIIIVLKELILSRRGHRLWITIDSINANQPQLVVASKINHAPAEPDGPKGNKKGLLANTELVAKANGIFAVKVTKCVRAGDELLFDYGPEYWRVEEAQSLRI